MRLDEEADCYREKEEESSGQYMLMDIPSLFPSCLVLSLQKKKEKGAGKQIMLGALFCVRACGCILMRSWRRREERWG